MSTITVKFARSGKEATWDPKAENLLDFAEDQARRRQQVFLKDWQTKLDEFLRFNDREVLENAGTIAKTDADEHARAEYAAFAERRRAALEHQGAEDSIKRLEDFSKDISEASSNRPDTWLCAVFH